MPGGDATRLGRALGGLAAAFALVTVLAWGILSLTWPESPVNINVRWTPDVVDAQRLELERRFRLTNSQQREGTTWTYELAETSTANIRALIQHERVDDTEHLNRIRYRPEFAQDRSRQILLASVAIGGFGSVLLLLLAGRRTAWFRDSWSSAFAGTLPSILASARASGLSTNPLPITLPPYSSRATAAAILGGVLMTAVMTSLAGASLACRPRHPS